MNNLEDVISSEFVNNPNKNNKFARILLYNGSNKPVLLIADSYIRNDFEYRLFVDEYNKAKVKFANKGFSIGIAVVKKDNNGMWQANNCLPIKIETI